MSFKNFWLGRKERESRRVGGAEGVEGGDGGEKNQPHLDVVKT